MTELEKVRALMDRANTLFSEGSVAEASEYFQRVAESQPDNSGALANLASCAILLKQPEAALAYAEKAIAINPEESVAHLRRGHALATLGRLTEALPALLKGVGQHADNASVLVYLATVYRELNQLDEALLWYDRALALEPGNVDGNFGRAMTYLQRGDFERGFAAYEWRWQKDELKGTLPKHHQPRWVGQLRLDGLTILLQDEQGLGDTIQFSRYALLLASAGAKVILQVPRALRPLFACFEDRMTVVTKGDPLSPFDCHSPLLSLPFACGTRVNSVPASVQYLAAPEDRRAFWKAKLGRRERPRIGIVWSGRPGHVNDSARSMSLAQFPIPNPELFDVFSLQHQVRLKDQPALDSLSITQLGLQFKDMADTAAVVELMDLVIAVDTSVAHLAAALGRPTWLLLPFKADWRWLIDRNDSPWYPTLRVFKQNSLGDWNDVHARVSEALAAMVGISARS